MKTPCIFFLNVIGYIFFVAQNTADSENNLVGPKPKNSCMLQPNHTSWALGEKLRAQNKKNILTKNTGIHWWFCLQSITS